MTQLTQAQQTQRSEAKKLLARWRNDPVRFAREALGVRLWPRQEEILRAIANGDRVAVRSGHKISKSFTAAVIALWWICTRQRGLVMMTSSSNHQIKNILWRELARVHREAKIAIGGVIGLDPATGLKFLDGRMIYGFSTNKKERMAGISGAELLFIVDEASGVDEDIHQAIEGNRAGGARIVMFSNPTQTSGTFYDAFNTKAEFWHGIHVSSEEAAALTPPISGLATMAWVEEKRKEWGPDSPIYAVRVLGNFPTQGSNSVVSLGFVDAGVARWKELRGEAKVLPFGPADGPLHLGVDVARFGDDESVIFPRRGKKTLPPLVFNGLDGIQLAARVLEAAQQLAPGERVKVKVDAIGPGAGVADFLRGKPNIDLVEVTVSENADDEEHYHRLRDQLWFGITAWLKDGGAIPDDGKLHGELVAPLYKFDERARYRVESKDDTKRRLQRSPDRADALALAIYGGGKQHTVTASDVLDMMDALQHGAEEAFE